MSGIFRKAYDFVSFEGDFCVCLFHGFVFVLIVFVFDLPTLISRFGDPTFRRSDVSVSLFVLIDDTKVCAKPSAGKSNNPKRRES